ncbi:GNAT family N-acetyltransferase [Mucilaginibacter sp.]|uniref:GNAT family N-acetyltransferase n=1 Tax=Mucilaginibacter sp. TaxID=1882438 RepID=UPI003B005339
MNPEVSIRQVTIEEAVGFAKFGAALFKETFAESNSAEDMKLYLEESFAIEKIQQELADLNTYCFYATKNSMPVGCMKLILTDASFTGIKSAELSRLYVSKLYHNQKVGAGLMQFAIDFSRKNQAEKLWLGVWEHNQKAINFYLDWGFVKTGEMDFKLGNDKQCDWLMEKTLT